MYHLVVAVRTCHTDSLRWVSVVWRGGYKLYIHLHMLSMGKMVDIQECKWKYPVAVSTYNTYQPNHTHGVQLLLFKQWGDFQTEGKRVKWSNTLQNVERIYDMYFCTVNHCPVRESNPGRRNHNAKYSPLYELDRQQWRRLMLMYLWVPPTCCQREVLYIQLQNN